MSQELSVGAQGDAVYDLQSKLKALGYSMSAEEFERKLFGKTTQEAVLVFQKNHGLPATGVVDRNTWKYIYDEADDKYYLDGQVFLEYGLPAKSVLVRLYSKGFGGAKTQLVESRTDDQGHFELSYKLDGNQTSTEVRIVDPEGKEISISDPKFESGRKRTLNLVAPAKVQSLSSEYERLAADMERSIGDLERLGDAQEIGGRRDLSILHHSTGWDARLIALLAKAAKLGREIGLNKDALYALYRVGLPTDKRLLAGVDIGTVEKALEKAKKAGILAAGFSVENAKREFQIFSRNNLRQMKAPGTLSSFIELLGKSGLSDDEKAMFEDAYFDHQGSPAEFWRKLAGKGIPADKIQRLRLQGKLSYLTLNNAAVVEGLVQELGSPDNLARLVELDLYDTNAWKARFSTMASDEEKMKDLIPPAYLGDKTIDRLEAYAADLARKVRLSFPTRVVGRLIEKGELSVGSDHEKEAVVTFLKKSEGLGFEFGRQSVEKFFKENGKALFGEDTPADKIITTKKSIEKMQRLYQITPSNKALKGLLELGFESAQDVAALPKERFDAICKDFIPFKEERNLIHQKAQQVSVVTYNLFTTIELLKGTPPTNFASASPEVQESVRNELIKHFPTMESLLGSLDFCECEHCQSVLSPAAYFVDLLHFLEPEKRDWQKFLEDWFMQHNGQIYQNDWNYDHNGEEYPGEKKKPYFALIERRPDLPSIPLTCENTNTALPYIDLVNEILEYYIANNDSLESFKGYDTGDMTTAELLAEPQNLLSSAYDILKNARYPLSLPFDLWLETVRMFFEHFEIPWWKVLQVYCRRGGELFDLQSRPAIENPTNDINATVVVPDSEATAFRVGYSVTYYDLSDNALHSETKIISSVGEPNSGGQGKTLITLSGVWTTPPPVANDLLVISSYTMAAIFNEYLGISQAEYDILTDTNPMKKWHELYGYKIIEPPIENPTNATKATVEVPDADAVIFHAGDFVTFRDVSADVIHNETQTISGIGVAGSGGPGKTVITLSGVWTTPPAPGDLLMYDVAATLKSAKSLARRLSISYKELTQIVQTGFVNPELNKATIIWKLRVNVSDIVGYFTNWTEDEKQDFELKVLSRFDAENKLENGSTLSALQKAWDGGTFKNVLLLRDTSGLCNFDQTYLEFAVLGSSAVEENDQKEKFKLALIRINLFVRLWKKLGWTIEEIDRALQVFIHQENIPVTADDPNLGAAFGNTFRTALVYMSHLKSLTEEMNLGKDARMKLLNIWSDLPTTGNKPLYDRLFLSNKSVSQNDPVFYDPLGKYLSYFDATVNDYLAFKWDPSKDEDAHIGNVALKNHLLTLQGALNLTANDIDHILADAEKNLDTEPLTLSNVSLLYRYWVMTKALEILIEDLIILKELSGIDPFRPLEPSAITSLDQDYPFSQTMRFSEVAKKIKATGFSLEDLNYLFSHSFDPAGKYRFSSDTTLGLMNTITTGIKQIHDEYAIIIMTDDVLRQRLEPKMPAGAVFKDLVRAVRELASNSIEFTDADLKAKVDQAIGTSASDELLDTVKSAVTSLQAEYAGLTDDTLKQKLSLVLPAEVVDKFFGFWNNTAEFSATKGPVDNDKKLDPITYAMPRIRVSYDAVRKRQQVTHIGVLTDEEKSEILGKIPSPDAAAHEATKEAYANFVELIDRIASESQPQPKEFLNKYFEGFLSYDDLYGSASIHLSDEARRHQIFSAILPFIQQKLVRQLIVQCLAANLSADTSSSLVEKLVTDKDLLTFAPDDGPSLLDAFSALGERGVNARFFGDQGSQLGSTINVDTVDTSIRVDNKPIKPTGSKRARFDGYFVVPKDGAYRFFLILGKEGAGAEFTLYHLPNPLITLKALKDGDEDSNFAELQTGILYQFSLIISDLHDGDVSLMVQPENAPRENLSALTLYPQTIIDQVTRSYVLLAKAIQLIQGLKLTEREVRYILTHRSDFDNINMSRLPTMDNDSVAASPATLFKQFLMVSEYAILKSELSDGSDDLINVLENSHRTYQDVLDKESAISLHFEPMARLTRRDSTVVREVAESLGFSADVTAHGDGYSVNTPNTTNVEKLSLLWKALQIVEKLGISAKSIVSWTNTIPDFSSAIELRNTVNARYEPENWQLVAQSIFDKLRQRKRDALVVYIMHKEGFERIEELFEFFLIDPGMEPVVQTSRIRLAISSVQLFIQRVLLNLEKGASPSTINSGRWQWMKHYRVWEANRKIFLFPENWLEPEFRDDKTHIFEECESALAQGDVSKDLAEDVFYNYLKELQRLARLDIVSMYFEDDTSTLHVIGRTQKPHKYFYRRFRNRMWTPWEPVTVEIGDGDHVVAVVWRERLHLFWATFMEKTEKKVDAQTSSNMTIQDAAANVKISDSSTMLMQKKIAVQLSWSEYFQGQWTNPQVSGFTILNKATVDNFDSSTMPIYATLLPIFGGAVKINFGEPIERSFYLLSKNDPPTGANLEEVEELPYNTTDEGPTKFKGSHMLTTNHVAEIEIEDNQISQISGLIADPIIKTSGEFYILPCTSSRNFIDIMQDSLWTLEVSLSQFLGDIFEQAPQAVIHEMINKLKDFSLSLPLRIVDQNTNVGDAIEDGWREIKADIENLDLPLEKSLFDQIDGGLFFLKASLSAEQSRSYLANAAKRKYINPFFYQDNRHTFFVEPTLTEITTPEYEDWGVPISIGNMSISDKDLDKIVVESKSPAKKSPPKPDPAARFKIKPNEDWITDPLTVLVFDNSFIGEKGGLKIEVLRGTKSNFADDTDTPVKSESTTTPTTTSDSQNKVVSNNQTKFDSDHLSASRGRIKFIGAAGVSGMMVKPLSNMGGGV